MPCILFMSMLIDLYMNSKAVHNILCKPYFTEIPLYLTKCSLSFHLSL